MERIKRLDHVDGQEIVVDRLREDFRRDDTFAQDFDAHLETFDARHIGRLRHVDQACANPETALFVDDGLLHAIDTSERHPTDGQFLRRRFEIAPAMAIPIFPVAKRWEIRIGAIGRLDTHDQKRFFVEHFQSRIHEIHVAFDALATHKRLERLPRATVHIGRIIGIDVVELRKTTHDRRRQND